MPKHDSSLVREYQKRYPGTGWDLYVWTNLADQNDHANLITFAYEDWLASNRSDSPPDLVEWIATYGYIRLRLETWELPAKLTPEEMEQWRAAGYYVTLDDFYKALGTVAAGIVTRAGPEPMLTAQIMKRQLREKIVELERLASLPLEQEYTPYAMPWQIRQECIKAGLHGEDLEDAIAEELLENDHMFQVQDHFEPPFALRQQLESFEWGMEILRMLIMGETAPKLGIPNRDLFEAFMEIDLNELLAQLDDIDIKLKRIWKHLASYKCYDLNADYEPERFWWRHWKKQPSKHGSGTSRSRGGRGKQRPKK